MVSVEKIGFKVIKDIELKVEKNTLMSTDMQIGTSILCISRKSN